jgi:hypothetical protein
MIGEDCKPGTHTWRWVSTWHGLGFDECTACGLTGPVRDGASSRSRDDGDTGSAAATPSAAQPQMSCGIDHMAELGRLLKSTEATGSSPAPRQRGGARQAVGQRRRGWKVLSPEQKVARDTEIVRAVEGGEDRVAIAARFGLHVSRISQLMKRARTKRASKDGE